MPTDLLSDAEIRRKAPAQKPLKLWDGDGLHLLVMPAGAKLWRFDYRYGGKRKTISLGAYSDVSLAEARRRRREARAWLSDGRDPSVERRAEKRRRIAESARSFAVVFTEWRERQSTLYAPPTLTRYDSVYAQLPAIFTSRPIAQIEPPDVLDVLRPMEARGRRSMAHRAKILVSLICRHAVATGDAKRDPTGDLKGALLPAPKRHYPTITDPDEIGRLLQAIDAIESRSSAGNALALLPYIFTRQSELRLMEWPEVDLDGALWTIPAAKTKLRRDHLVPLARQVVERIRSQPRETDARYVFPSLRTRHRPLSEITLNVALIRAGYSPQQIVPHGFRAMARTLLDERLRVDPILIEVQLAHQVPGVLGDTYNRARYLEQRVEMMQKWADYLDELRESTRGKTN